MGEVEIGNGLAILVEQLLERELDRFEMRLEAATLVGRKGGEKVIPGVGRSLLADIPDDFPVPILVVQHLSERVPSHLIEVLSVRSRLPVSWMTEGQRIAEPGVWGAPPGYHVSVDGSERIRLSQTERVNYVRPSADVLLQSAAARYGDRLLAVILTGKGRDGAAGAAAVKLAGGRVLAQNVRTCAAAEMPSWAITNRSVDLVLPLAAIAPALVSLVMVAGAADLLRVQSAPHDEQPKGVRTVDWQVASTLTSARWSRSRWS